MAENLALQDKFAPFLGAEVVSREDKRATVKLTVKPEFLNGVKTAHGGLIFSLADYAFALAANSSGEDGVAIAANVQFTKPAFENDVLEATVEESSRSRRVGVYIGTVRNQKKEMIAQFQSTAYFKHPKT